MTALPINSRSAAQQSSRASIDVEVTRLAMRTQDETGAFGGGIVKRPQNAFESPNTLIGVSPKSV